jgi:RES domain-containing protein
MNQELGPPAEPLTLTLAETLTFTLAAAVTDAATCDEQDTASAPSAAAVVATVLNAETASGPWFCTALRSAGMLVPSVVWSAVTAAVADPWQEKVTLGGVHVAEALACAWQLPWQFASAWHEGGAT